MITTAMSSRIAAATGVQRSEGRMMCGFDLSVVTSAGFAVVPIKIAKLFLARH